MARRKKSPLEPTPKRTRAYELPNLVNVQTPSDPIRQIENEAIRDLSNEYRTLRIEELIAKKKKQLTASVPTSNIQAQKENLEYIKTVMELSKMNQPKEGPDQTLEYLKFFNQMNLQNQQLNAPSSFFDQYLKAREMGIVGNPSTGEHNQFSVELEKLRSERMMSGKKIDLELHKMRLEQESNQGKIGMIGQIVAPFMAYSGAKLAEDMKARGADMGNRYRNSGNSQNALNEFLQEQGIINPNSLQGKTAEMKISCPCGYDKVLMVPLPPPAQISCPGCGKTLQTGPAPSGDEETREQWERT